MSVHAIALLGCIFLAEEDGRGRGISRPNDDFAMHWEENGTGQLEWAWLIRGTRGACMVSWLSAFHV